MTLYVMTARQVRWTGDAFELHCPGVPSYRSVSAVTECEDV
jgi:hypothetical protein